MTEFDARPEGEGTLYPVLPLRDIVVFPHMIVPLFVGREKSIRALEEVMAADKQILLATQVNASDDDPSPSSEPKSPESDGGASVRALLRTSARRRTLGTPSPSRVTQVKPTRIVCSC